MLLFSFWGINGQKITINTKVVYIYAAEIIQAQLITPGHTKCGRRRICPER